MQCCTLSNERVNYQIVLRLKTYNFPCFVLKLSFNLSCASCFILLPQPFILLQTISSIFSNFNSLCKSYICTKFPSIMKLFIYFFKMLSYLKVITCVNISFAIFHPVEIVPCQVFQLMCWQLRPTWPT